MRNHRTAHQYDIVMLGTFAAWRLGTLQVRALPFARELASRGIRIAMVTVPWDIPSEAGVVDVFGGVPVFNTRAGGSSSTAQIVREQRRLMRSLTPRAVHLFKPRGFGGLSSLHLGATIPVIVDADDWEGDGGWNRHGQYGLVQRRFLDWQERSLLAHAAAVTSASTLLERRARFLRTGPARERVWAIPNGLEIEWFEQLAEARSRQSQTTSGRREIVLYSRMEEFPSTWIPQFVAALGKHLAEPVTLRIVGQSAARSCPGSVAVEPMGYVARSRVPQILASAQVAIYPYADSLITRSKQSIKLLELMAAGCAIVASDVGDVAATLGMAGVTLQGAEPEAFASAIAALLNDPQTVASTSHDSIERVRSHFVVPVVADRLAQVYRALRLIP